MAQLLEYIKMAFFNILSNKVRSLLTMLGIIIGISSVILIMSLGNGAKDMINNQLSLVGNKQLAIMSTSDEEYITREDLEALKEQVDGITAYLNPISYEGSVTTAKGTFTAYTYGCNAENYMFEQYSILSKGKYFDETEYENGKMVCYIASDDAIKMFGNTDVIGMPVEITINGKILEYTIVGITDYAENASMISYSFEGSPIYLNVPSTSLETALGINTTDIKTNSATLMLADDTDTQKTCDEVIALLNARHNCQGEDIFIFQTFADYMSTINTVINMITLFIALVAAISLIVGGVGVMNIMLVSVTERTREIGIRKALGAKTGSITLQFLSESAIITLLGGILGILIGLGGAYLITEVISLLAPTYAFSPSISLGVILVATLFSSAVGIFFGIYPARKAAKMNPIDALRSM